MCFDSYNSKRTGFEFDLTAGGSKIDRTLGNGELEWDTTWDAVWDGKVAYDTQDWTAEFRIPFNGLLRGDCIPILNYAADKGLYTKITSNGTLPIERYRELLGSKITEISISLDGVSGNDLPYSHIGPKILDTIRYLNDHLPKGKKLTLNITVSQANRENIQEIVAYCTREYPKARLWLNPVVVGEGRLRTGSEPKIKPDYLRQVDSPTLLAPEFFKRGAEEQYQKDIYKWGCLAGRFSFDIKPNGDFWICQDFPAANPLNILDPDFTERFRKADYGCRPECSGCTYSCYFVTQKLFEPANWPDMAIMWWKTVTMPGDPCRSFARKHGWLAGLLFFATQRALGLLRQPAAATLLLILLGTVPLWAQAITPPVDPAVVIERMEQSNAARWSALQSYQSVRRYEAGNSRLNRHALMVTEMLFETPDKKTFRILESSGSKIILGRVLQPLINAERSTALQKERLDLEMSRRNYLFAFLQMEPDGTAYLFAVEPIKPSKMLLRGKIWVDAESFGIRRVEGEPSMPPSFWVHRTHVVHEYGRFGQFWFPVINRSEAELRIFGKSKLRIDYYDYQWQLKAALVAESVH